MDLKQNHLQSLETLNPLMCFQIKQDLESKLTNESANKITSILENVKSLNDQERLLLYIKLPGYFGYALNDTLVPSLRSEQLFACKWVKINLTECEFGGTIAKHTVYEEYTNFCQTSAIVSILSAPDFGKVVRMVFPDLKPRRLGVRGQTKYCYSGIKWKNSILPSSAKSTDFNIMDETKLPVLEKSAADADIKTVASTGIICEWATSLTGKYFRRLEVLAEFLVLSGNVPSNTTDSRILLKAIEIEQKNLSNNIKKCGQFNSDDKIEPITSNSINEDAIKNKNWQVLVSNFVETTSTTGNNYFSPINEPVSKKVYRSLVENRNTTYNDDSNSSYHDSTSTNTGYCSLPNFEDGAAELEAIFRSTTNEHTFNHLSGLISPHQNKHVNNRIATQGSPHRSLIATLSPLPSKRILNKPNIDNRISNKNMNDSKTKRFLFQAINEDNGTISPHTLPSDLINTPELIEDLLFYPHKNSAEKVPDYNDPFMNNNRTNYQTITNMEQFKNQIYNEIICHKTENIMNWNV